MRLDRRTLSCAALLAVVAFATAAMTADADDVAVHFQQGNDFDIVVAGSGEAGWEPADVDWEQGDRHAYTVLLSEDGALPMLAPGGSLSFRIAARNTSDLPALLSLSVSDPDVRTGETDPATGYPVELFEQLHFTVTDGSRVLLRDVDGATVTAVPYAWPRNWRPGEARVLDVTIALPEGLGNEWQGASTGIQFGFEAHNG